jgi:drug/metabolite transporter (DMT)-like permease
MRKDRMDAAGAAALIGLALLFAGNQVSIKIVNGGFQPLIGAAIRSAIAAVCVAAFMLMARRSFRVAPGTGWLGLAAGAAFAGEFLCLYIALDRTTVSRATVFMYSMPVWLALVAHWLYPGERITVGKAAGLALALGGVAVAMADRGGGAAAAPFAGDVLALLGAMGWAAVAILAREQGTRGVSPEMQLLWMLVVSTPLLFAAAPLFGPFLRDPGPLEWGVLIFQSVVIVAAGFLAWFWLLGRYPSGAVASFSFLSPVFGILLGWGLLGEPVGPLLLVAGALVAAGLVLINWPRQGPPAQVPQKVRTTT